MVLQRPDQACCGPIAIINAYKYVYGTHLNITGSRLGSLMNMDNEYGTEPWEICDNPYVKLKKKTFNIDKMLEMNAFILLHIIDFEECHYVFVHKENNKYIVHNYYCPYKKKFLNKPFTKFHFKNIMLNKIKGVDELDYPIAWELNY